MTQHMPALLATLLACVAAVAPAAGTEDLFAGADLETWQGSPDLWRFEDGELIGLATERVAQNEFIYAPEPVGDFHLSVEVKLVPNRLNAGIQFRSSRLENGHALGYQADIGRGVWGRLYHEYGRGQLDWTDAGERHVRPGEWNRYEILAVGHRIWTAINGHLSVATLDEAGELEGLLAFQIHSGPPQEVRFRDATLTREPVVDLAGMDEAALEEALRPAPLLGFGGPRTAVDSPSGAPVDSERNAADTAALRRTPPGVEAILYASEPLLASPTNLDVDRHGRVWVIDVMNYREHGENDQRPEGDRILILDDADGDGVADQAKVYYQGRDIDAALGIAVLGNQVIVTAAPEVIVFTDEDGDDLPDSKESLFTRTGLAQNDHSTHSFVFGPDGKYYWNMGNAGMYVHDARGLLVHDRFGLPVAQRAVKRRFPGEFDDIEPHYLGGMVFRCNPDGSDFEVLGHNFRNNYEVAVDSFGNLWQSDNDDDGYRGVRINYVMEYGNYGYRDEMTAAAWAQPRTGQSEIVWEKHWHQNDPGVVPDSVYLGAGSPTGITVYEGRLLPEVYWDRPLHADAGPGVVRGVATEKTGAGWTGEMVPLLDGEDRWARPVDVAVAPDGAVYVSDWYDPVVSWNRQADLDRGRVLRLAPPGHRSQRSELDLSTAAGAVAALESPNADARFGAWQALRAMGAGAEEALAELFESGRATWRARALWLLSKIEGRGPSWIERGLADEDEDIRVVAVRAARQMESALEPVLEQAVADASPQVRREVALALRSNEVEAAADLWTELALRHDGEDRWYLEALGIAAEDRWDEVLASWLAKAGDEWNTAAGRDLIWRSRATATPGLLQGILADADLGASDAARYLRTFDFQRASAAKEDALRGVFLDAAVTAGPAAAFVASEAAVRLERVDLEDDHEVASALSKLLGSDVAPGPFVRLVGRYELDAHYPKLAGIAAAHGSEAVGQEAISTLLALEQDEVIESFLAGATEAEAAGLVEALGRSRELGAVAHLGATALDDGLDWRTRDQAVRGLARTRAGATRLVEMGEQQKLPEELHEVAGAALSGVMQVPTRERAARVFRLPPTKDAEPLPQMTDLLVRLGDVERGREVFTAATCGECHIVAGEGTEYGPDLSTIGSKLAKRGLYESILDPSASISPTYAPYLFELANGESVVGMLVSETDDRLIVRTEGGIVTEYGRAEVDSVVPQSVSIMPSDLSGQVTVEDLIDLVEYLTTLR
ncbi:MAG: DUF1080 domain-containing protein [Acidobacteria bacterium]|nr:DUF1080 domain-containing protein [Acidobacteriota bacterium]